MIVNPAPTGWQIIYQQAHAQLAMQLAWHWPPFLPASRWVDLLSAIAQHDHEQEDWHGRGGHYGLTPAGAPADFTQKEFSLAQATGVLAAARFQGRWRSLLTAMHLSCLYEGLRGSSTEITAFLDELKSRQQQWRRALKVTKAEAESAYALLHWSDRLSLILCRQELPEMGRRLEIYQGPDGRRYTLRRPQPEGPVIIEPWPFASAEVEVTVEVTTLHRLQFRDDADLATALHEAPIEELRWELRPGD
ncbi:hypothetical protein GCM10023185_27640 [Hymenobacter saemangeumensis]|uniref:DUF3891 family protein n=1 Tax=Hymenobacter saemangeumensis TaxID=1084522 RepID=A0ABP8IK33_9BACT